MQLVMTDGAGWRDRYLQLGNHPGEVARRLPADPGNRVSQLVEQLPRARPRAV